MVSLYRRRVKRPDGTVNELPTWWLKYYQNGRVIRESSGSRKETVARRMLRVREGDVEHGISILPKAGRLSFEDAAKDLLNDYQINGKRTLVDVKRRLDLHLTPLFRGRRMAAISSSDAREFIAARQSEGASNGEINRELAALKRMFNLAIQAGKLFAKPHIPMLREDNVRRGFFERDAFEAVVTHLPPALRPVGWFAYLTGWRLRSEVLPLQWRQVDWDAAQVRLDPGTTKNREGRSFPFTGELRVLLERQWADHQARRLRGEIVPWVFHRDGERIRNLHGAWRSACKAAGVPGRLMHDLRRTAVRNLECAGVSRAAAMAIVGHKTESVYRRYAIVDAATLREASAKIDTAAARGEEERGRLGELSDSTAAKG